ncbi:MAG: GIY-YIG nuclease family protein, partial [Patescibacteria group bacterium]|nr:GIY-YIG nuclease family protein [Patescibacteria group bacterium]
MNSLNLPYKPADIPDVSGVYLFYGNSGQILYVGKAKILRERLRSYLTPDNAKTGNLMALSKTVSYIPVDNEIDALILEANLIKKHQPRFNVNFKDGKNYPFIKITLSEKYPKLYTARKVDKSSKDLYFGPYPTGLDLKFIMRYIRRIFPFCTHRKPYSSCLYFHLGLCPGPEFKVDKKTYFQNIKKIVLFLSGDKSKVINLLNKDLKSEIRAQRFENAKIIYGQIKKLENFATF